MALPNGKVVDLLTPVLAEIQKWIQDEPGKPESGGFIVGYKHKETGNISLEEVSHPYLLDHKSRVHFDIKDPRHKAFLLKAQRKKSFYIRKQQKCNCSNSLKSPKALKIQAFLHSLKCFGFMNNHSILQP